MIHFFRGTYYRWTQLWPEICTDLQKAPIVLGVGDLHVESFGTWRDREGRLCWGVDDFDDAYPLPYTNDLVRLAASIRMVTDSKDLTIGFRDGCDAVLEGYSESLTEGGCPFVLAEHEKNLERLGIEAIKPPQDFWANLTKNPSVARRDVPIEAREAWRKTLVPRLRGPDSSRTGRNVRTILRRPTRFEFQDYTFSPIGRISTKTQARVSEQNLRRYKRASIRIERALRGRTKGHLQR